MARNPEEFRQINEEAVNPPKEEQQGAKPDQVKTPAPLVFEKVISPEHLEMISQSSGGFRFRPDASLEPGKTGYTDLQTKTIFYNPLMLAGSPEFGITPWTKTDIKGFAYHEAGHHAPETVTFQNELLNDLKNIEIPEAYKGSVSAEERFVAAVWSNVGNTVADMWLESFMGRRPYYSVNKAITEFQKGKGDVKDYRVIQSKSEQLLQALLRSRYFGAEDMENRMDPEVFASFQKIMKSGAMQAIVEKSPFENYFATETQKKLCLEGKMVAYKQVFLPEYIKLLEKELEERKKAKQQGKGGMGQGGSGGAPLTKEEEEELVEQIIQELEKTGKERESQAPSEEEKNQVNSSMQKVRRALEQEQARKEGKETAKPEEEENPEKKKGEEAIRELARELERKQREKARAGAAEQFKVNPETIRMWERIKQEYKGDIASLASSLAEVFLDDRRKKMEYLRREGDIVPGLEYETVSANISGDADPQTKMSTVRNPEFLETELEFIVDTSGSMGGEKIKKSIELLVVITEGMKRVRELLSSENLLSPESEQPLQLGVTKFSDNPERVTKLTDPLSDQKEVNIIDSVSKIGGGTEESGAISSVYQELKLGKKNVIKIICILTDGEGNRKGVESILAQIEKDKEVVFLAVGLGNSPEDAKAIVQTYVAPLNNKQGNIHGFAAEDPAQALPGVLEFLKREVNKRKK